MECYSVLLESILNGLILVRRQLEHNGLSIPLGFFAHLCDEEIRCATFIFNDILQTDQKNLAQIQTLILYNIQFLPKP